MSRDTDQTGLRPRRSCVITQVGTNSKALVLSCSGSVLLEQQNVSREARWPSGRALDSGARGRGFDPHSGRSVVSLSKIHLPPKKYW